MGYRKNKKTTPWGKYEKELRKDRRFKRGIKQLKEAHRLFAKCSFNTLTDDERKYLAGTIGKNKRDNIRESDKIDWYMFGTLVGARKMKKHINNNNKKINDALEAIPLKGDITKAMYRKYLNKLRSIEGLDVGPAVCSRLLAMKRPDFFMSLNKQSKPVISRKYGIPMAKLTADTYWDLIMKIHEDDWYRHPKNTEAKPYRMALMDCLIREWK